MHQSIVVLLPSTFGNPGSEVEIVTFVVYIPPRLEHNFGANPAPLGRGSKKVSVLILKLLKLV